MQPSAFRTASGRPVPAVTAEEMRAVDRVAVEAFGIEVLQMMEHAGRTLARQVRATGPDAVTVLAGDGGNGGGGLCCARHLANRGVDVRVVLDRDPAALSGPAAHHHGTLAAMDVPVGVGPDALDAPPDAAVDALVGYGLSGPLRGTAADLVNRLASFDGRIVSLDVPSGVDATTGERPGAAVRPDHLVTLALPKTGLSDLETTTALADIGLPVAVYDRLDIPSDSPFGDEYAVPISPA